MKYKPQTTKLWVLSRNPFSHNCDPCCKHISNCPILHSCATGYSIRVLRSTNLAKAIDEFNKGKDDED